MKTLTTIAITTIYLLNVASLQAAMKPAAQVKAAKGPVQITFQLHKTTVKPHKSLWYKITLKNIGKKKILVEDWIYKDPWALHQNSRRKLGTYLEVVDPKGKQMTVRWGGEEVKFDYEPERGQTKALDPKDELERNAYESGLKKRGLTDQQRHIAMSEWDGKWNDRKRTEELVDPTKQLWLKPGVSTMTSGWAYTDHDEYADHSTDEPQIGDYTQLWSYDFFDPGKYRIRVVYKHAASESSARTAKYKLKSTPPDWWVTFKTPFIEFEVLP